MSKVNKNNSQPSLFEWVKQAEALTRQIGTPATGSLDIDSEFRSAVSADIKACPLSRFEIAARMSDLAGTEITEKMLYNYTAESSDKHRFPCQFLPAFVIATGGRRAFEVLSKKSGLFALPGPEALRAEIQRLDDEEKRIRSEKVKRKFYLKEIEGGKE